MSQAKPPTQFSRDSASRWLWSIGVALVVFAARCREIHLYASIAPFLDQWDVEAQQILVPWLNGELTWAAFFSAHHEHYPAWTRLIVWLEATLLGRWDPLLQCTLNASIWGVTLGIWSDWLRRHIPRLPAVILTVLATILASLPYSWENTTWGFQSHFPLALLFITWYIHGSFAESINTRRWWVAQFAGFSALFTLGSMWAAPLALLIVMLWTNNSDRRHLFSAGILSILGLAMMLFARSIHSHEGALTLNANSIQQFLAAFFIQLGWPAQFPAAGMLLYLPTLLLGWHLFRQKQAAIADRIILAIALWSIAQAAAFAIARSGEWMGFVSRYGDLLALGVLANSVALWRLLQGWRHARILVIAITIAWIWALAPGLQWISTRAHTQYFHQHSALWSMYRGEAVRDYLATKSMESLSKPEVRNVLHPDPKLVAEILDTPGLSDLLPAQLRPNAQRNWGDFYSSGAMRIRSLWPSLLTGGIVLFILGLMLTIPQTVSYSLPLAIGAKRNALPWLVALTASSLLLMFLWPMPLVFNAKKRWKQMLVPIGYAGPLHYKITTPTTYVVDNLTGGAALWPEDFRNTFYGTHIDGPGFIGTAQSSTFELNSPTVVIPIAGSPHSPENGIVLRIEGPEGNLISEIKCTVPNPETIGFWQVDIAPHQGNLGRIVLYDGRNDQQGWVAAGSPQPASGKDAATKLNSAWALEQTSSAHRTLGVLNGFLILVTITAAFRHWRRSKAH